MYPVIIEPIRGEIYMLCNAESSLSVDDEVSETTPNKQMEIVTQLDHLILHSNIISWSQRRIIRY
jgi:hypothetical protein